MNNDYIYGYNDGRDIPKLNYKKTLSLILAILFLTGIWFFLNYKLIFGENWISATYDHDEWRTNEGFVRTLGAWDFEAHVWKSVFIMENFPNFQWNPYWYMGMPLLEYYPAAFYIFHISLIFLTGLSAAKAGTFLVIFGHLIATLLTFLLCYKVSRKIWVSALASSFLLSNAFMSLRSYGWEPISVVFLFMFPLVLLVFLGKPTKPFRFWLILVLALSYLMHPLIFVASCMFMLIYLFSLALRNHSLNLEVKHRPYIIQLFMVFFIALLIGAVAFLPQWTYEQVTSGAHMGVSYIPFYHIPFNVIPLNEFFLDAGNLKGPGLIMVSALILTLLFLSYERKNKREGMQSIFNNYIASGVFIILFLMVSFYYMELFDIFPMNYLRSVQYHRIIPEFIITAAIFISALSNNLETRRKKVIYYSVIILFSLVSLIVVYNIQTQWYTADSISDSQESIYEGFDGRMTFPYIDQSLAVRNSFTNQYQTYGYYEQGITNSYLDEIFSVSSGFHDAEVSILYLKAANVGRLYINMEEGDRNEFTYDVFDGFLTFIYNEGDRRGYFEIPLENPNYAQAVDINKINSANEFRPGCRILFETEYCESKSEEFVTKDLEEIRYLKEYLEALDSFYEPQANYKMVNPQVYELSVFNATRDTAVVIKMTYDSNFRAYVDEEKIEVKRVGPDFMIIHPEKEGDYTIFLEYKTSKRVLIGGIISIVSFIGFILFFIFKPNFYNLFKFREGDLNE